MNEAFKYAVKALPSEFVSLSVTYSGHQQCSAAQRWGKGVREQYILHYVVSGKGVYSTPQGNFELSAGDIFLIRPFTEIEYYPDPDDPWEYRWVNFTGADAEIILSRTDFTPDSPVMSGCGEDILPLMEAITENPGQELYNSLELTGTLYRLLAALVKRSGNTSPLSKRSEERHKCLRAALDYIAANYPLPISVDDIAAAAAVSRSTLFRLFRTELNTAPSDYLIDFRIEQAKKLLSETDISVTAAARSAGYENNLYFSRAFRKVTGMTPTEYRKSRQNNRQGEHI
ncbi:MAG: AraC family transcriptional regulator [Oscillospiraceae bacterium]|nr:AraC family transcriptional regulator [Oscillospiraceae bacterium]